MTYNDLYKEIIALGFQSEIDSEERITTSVSRALSTIFTERPVFSNLSIYQRKYRPTLKINAIEHKGTEVDTVNYNARCYSFVSSGNGSYRISEGEDERVFAFSGENKIHKGFLHGEGKIEFFGDYSFVINNLSLFDELFGASENDVPICFDYREYDITDYTDDFLSFTTAPCDDTGRAIDGAAVCGRLFRIPSDYSGRINLTYKIRSKGISGVADEQILVPEGCEHLVALLAASYIWLDDDSEKAEYYMSLYREGMSASKYYNRTQIGADYHSINGWA